MSHWNHRVMRQKIDLGMSGDMVQFGVHEVHYDDAGRPAAHSGAVGLRGESYRDVLSEWAQVARAFEKPILEYVDGEYREMEARL